MDIVVNNTIEIESPELKKVTNDIRKASANVIGNTFKIAYLISKVNTEKLYEPEFDDVFSYTKNCFGLEKTSTYNLMRVGDNFIEAVSHGKITSFETLLTHGDKDYSISQVFKMLPLGIDKAKELTANGVIDETMTCRQIEKIVKENTEGNSNRGQKKESGPEDNDNEPEDNDNETEDSIIQVTWDKLPDEVQKWFMTEYHFESFNDIREIDII